MSVMKYDVIIVGGGIAGLSAAATLNQNKIKSSLVVEAGDRFGGRMWTNQGLDLGAQWIHGGVHANSVYNYAIKHGLVTKENKSIEDTELENFYTSNGRVIDIETARKAWRLYEKIYNESENYCQLENKTEQISLKKFYEKAVSERLEELEEDHEKDYDFEDVKLVLESLILQFEGYCGDTLEDASLSCYGTSVELPGGDVQLPSGTSSIIQKLEDEVQNKVLNTKITNIEWKENYYCLSTEKRDCIYKAKHVILAVPLGVIQNKSISITPSLGETKETALKNLRPGRISKIFLHFDQPFWIPGECEIIFVWTKQEIEDGELNQDWTRRVSSMHGIEGCNDWLCMWVSGEAAAIVDHLEDKQILQGAKDLLKRFTGDPGISLPDRIYRHAWLKDPLFLGTWSYPSIHTKHQDYYELMKPEPSEENPRLLLAGEHTHPTYWSFMHGARLSGIEQANKIIKYMELNPEQY